MQIFDLKIKNPESSKLEFLCNKVVFNQTNYDSYTKICKNKREFCCEMIGNLILKVMLQDYSFTIDSDSLSIIMEKGECLHDYIEQKRKFNVSEMLMDLVH